MKKAHLKDNQVGGVNTLSRKRANLPLNVQSVVMPREMETSPWWPWVATLNPLCPLLEKMVKLTYKDL